MALTTTQANSGKIVNLRFSAFLGTMYVSTPEAEKELRDVKAAIGGETEVKKGFTGNTGDSASAKAIRMLKDKGWAIPLIADGRLGSVYVQDHEIQGADTPFLKVSLRDDDAVYYLSVQLDNEGAQMLARKLANAQPGLQTWLNMMTTYDGERDFSNQGASLRQEKNDKEHEVKGVDPKTELAPRIAEASEKLVAAGFKPRDANAKNDHQMFMASRDKVTLQFHLELVQKVKEAFTEHYAQRDAAKAAAAANSSTAEEATPEKAAA